MPKVYHKTPKLRSKNEALREPIELRKYFETGVSHRRLPMVESSGPTTGVSLMNHANTPAASFFQDLSQSQYLNPHAPVEAAVMKVLADRVSSLEQMNDRLVRAGIDHHSAIGRLKRDDLLKLSKELAQLTIEIDAPEFAGQR
jgi:hypothetical protein